MTEKDRRRIKYHRRHPSRRVIYRSAEPKRRQEAEKCQR
jgi:hypothetical protein